MRILKYQKITDKYTTYTVNDEENRITELCTINGDTYISVPDNVTLPKQPKEITLKPVIMTDELKEQIEEISPHIRLIKKRIKDKIREKYSIEDELKIIRNKINGIEVEKYTEYNNYVEGCITEGRIEKEALIANVLEPIK
jgi:hypothetical protein